VKPPRQAHGLRVDRGVGACTIQASRDRSRLQAATVEDIPRFRIAPLSFTGAVRSGFRQESPDRERMDALGSLQLRKDGTILVWAKETASQHQRSTGHPSEDSDEGPLRPTLWQLSTVHLCIWWRLRRRKAPAS